MAPIPGIAAVMELRASDLPKALQLEYAEFMQTGFLSPFPCLF